MTKVYLDLPPSVSQSNHEDRMCLKFKKPLESTISISNTEYVEVTDTKIVITFEGNSAVNIKAKENLLSFYSYKHSFPSKVTSDDIATILEAFPNDDIEDEMLEKNNIIEQDQEFQVPYNNISFDHNNKCNLDCIRVVQQLPAISLDSLYNFFEVHGHFSREKVCPNCGDQLRIKYGRFFCRKQNSIKSKKRQIVCFSQTAFKDSWFDCGTNKAKKIILICFLYVSGVPSIQVKQRVKIHNNCDWYEACQNVVIDFFKRSSQRIGGSGITVEMIVTKVHISASNKLWVIGGIEVQSKRSFMVTVSNLTKKFLFQIMASWINRGTQIISDSFNPQIDFEEHGFVLESENSSCSSETIDFDSSDCNTLHQLFMGKKLYSPEKLIYNLYEKKLPKIEERFHEFIIAAGVSYSKR
uniref:Uncharacterized protein n=1 Tax=Lepeophtheirus salmonis TaxID=72036 RepID=A0A0K2SZW6_LEPSM